MFDFSADLQKYAGFWCHQDIKAHKHRDFFSSKESQSNWWGFLSCSVWVCCKYACVRTDTAEWGFSIRSVMWLGLGRCRYQPSTAASEKVEVKCNYLCPGQLMPGAASSLAGFCCENLKASLVPFFIPLTGCLLQSALYSLLCALSMV